MSSNVTALILGGGQGKRLFPLTSYRSKPAVPIGGKYRLVDIPISNAINSGITRIFVLTQFNSTSLHRHIHRTYPYEPFHQTSVELLAAEQTLANTDWFQGTADAVRKHQPHYHLNSVTDVLILSGDHLYRMDYQEILDYHRHKNADVTVATVPVRKSHTRHFGIMQIQAGGKITAFWEKPAPTENIRSYVIPLNIRNIFHLPGKGEQYLASMGVYVFKPEVLQEVLKGKEADFGREVIPKAIQRKKVYGFVFNGYWRDIGTISSFYEASLELTKPNPSFSFLMPLGRIFTRARFLPPSKILSAEIKNCLAAEGCILEGAHIEDSVVGLRSVVGKGSVIRKSVLMGNDFYNYDRRTRGGRLGIGKNCVIEKCILDKNVSIGNNVKITNPRRIKEMDGKNFYVREGIVIIPKGARIEGGAVL
ncbi:MAG: glucose-1-phosphate adenylyltransferase [Candidatus Omnitrophica bacterium]|nr:glucose-1-phosphate adenylyltransferase [Candidatus Omnitrophota bacterium]